MEKISQILASLGIIGLILYVVNYMMGRAKTDAIISDLKLAAKRKEREEFEKNLIQAQKELEDAKIEYNNSRRNLDTDTSDLR